MKCRRHGVELVPFEVPGYLICPTPHCQEDAVRIQPKQKRLLTCKRAHPRHVEAELELFAGEQEPGSDLEAKLLRQLAAYDDLPRPSLQFRFDPTHRYRFDLAWPELMLAVEVNGGTWSKRRLGHNSGAGIAADYRKLNAAAIRGWAVLLYEVNAIESGAAATEIAQVVRMRSGVNTGTENGDSHAGYVESRKGETSP